jgi:gas vesicle protein
MDGQNDQTRDFRFVTGLAVGSLVGAGLALLLAPRAGAEIRARAAESVRDLGDAVSERYKGAKLRVADTVDGMARKGQKVRDEVCDTVVRGAQQVERGARDVERFAIDAKTQNVV